MFAYLESREEIHRAQQVLTQTVRQAFRSSVKRGIGFPGGNVHQAVVNTDGYYWYRTADSDPNMPNPRRLNWFGLYNADDTYYLSISVEINTAYEGRNDNVAGFFGRDNNTGTVYLFHSGRVSGGTKGVSKTAFLAWSSHCPDVVLDSAGNPRFGVLVMPVEGRDATRGLTRYIDAVAQFKTAVRAGPLENSEYKKNQEDLERFYAEARGRRQGRRSAVVDYLSRHGDVVDALFSRRKSQPLEGDARIVKNVLIDLGVRRDGHLSEVFEVKTSAARGDVYAAIGQLMVHGAQAGCRWVAVLPKDQPLAADLKEVLERLRIEVLTFRLDEAQATIE
jgi:hypothetical protein